MVERLVVVGSGMATARLLEALAERDAQYDITVIGEEPQPSYNRILLSSLLCGDKTEDDLVLLSGDWYADRAVALITGERVDVVDTDHCQLTTSEKRIVHYDRLVFATGSRAHIPAIPGANAEGVMGFRSLVDLDRIRAFAENGNTAVVVGGGLLGLEAAHGLNALGMEVTVVHRREYPMNRQLDPEAGHLLRATLEARGLRFVMNAAPESIVVTDHRASGVRLAGGEVLAADLVIFAAGIDPNLELAQAAGIRCEHAIVVNEYLEADEPDIYALGECCQIDGRTFGLVAPVWRQAEILADRLCAIPGDGYRHVEAPTQLKVSGIDLYSAGSIPFGDDTSSQVVRDPANGVYRRLVFRGPRLVGAILLGDRSGGAWYGTLIENGEDVSSYRAQMMFGENFCVST